MTAVVPTGNRAASAAAAPDSPMAPLAAALLDPQLAGAFAALDGTGMPWVVLRSADRLPGPVAHHWRADGSDPAAEVDVLVARGAREQVAGALALAGFALLPRPGRGSHRFYLAFDEGSTRWLKLDVVDDLAFGRWAEVQAPIATVILGRRVRRGAVAVPAPADEAWLETLHLLLDREALDPDARGRLEHDSAALAMDGPVPGWLDSVSAGTAERVARALRAGDVAAARAAARHARAASVGPGGAMGPGRAVARAVATIALRRLSSVPRPWGRRGLYVALLGPDGSGKSSVADSLQLLSPLPVRTFYLGAYPEAQGGQPRPTRLPGASLMRRLGRLAGTSVAARGHAWRGGLAVADRHPIEALLRGEGGARRWLVGHAALTPDLFVILDAPADVLVGRKAEHSVDRIAADRAMYERLVRSDSSVVVVDARPSIERTAAAVMAGIWAAFASAGADQ
ncbi:MAG: hypothetical protein ACJ76W_10110 [Chloroflexota bacterium]